MRLIELFEAKTTTVAFCFGRFNPAHKGHVQVWQTVQQAGNEWYVGTNPNTHGPNDPLTFEQKAAWMETIWPEIKGHIMPEKNVMTLATTIYNRHGKKTPISIAYVTDDDDWKWSGKLLNDYNGKESAHGFYQFSSIIHVPSPRVSSATELRNAARADDPKAFYAAAGVSPKLKVAGKTYYDTVREACLAQPEKKKKKVKESVEQEIQELISYLAFGGLALGTAYTFEKLDDAADWLIHDLLNKRYPVTPGTFRDAETAAKYKADRESLQDTYHSGGLLGLYNRYRTEKKQLSR